MEVDSCRSVFDIIWLVIIWSFVPLYQATRDASRYKLIRQIERSASLGDH